MPDRRPTRSRPRLAPLEPRDCPATFTVTSTDDNGGVNPAAGAGTGTLRQAIIDANAEPGIDTIAFDIAGAGVHVIRPAAQLPEFLEAAILDGYTQPDSKANTLAVGSDANLLIEIDGNGTGVGVGVGFVLRPDQFDGMTVRGISFVNFSNVAIGVRSNSGPYDNFIIEGNYFGVRADGVTARANSANLFLLNDGHRVGGDTPAARNVFSASKGHGLTLSVSNSVVAGNYIGTDASGMVALPNAANGILIQGNGNTVGGTTAGARNVISGNAGDGIGFNGAGGSSTNTTIAGNYIGVAADGKTALPNARVGIVMTAVSGINVIGGTDPAARNVISGNGGDGIFLGGSGQEVRGNYIGTDATGAAAVPNNGHGVYVTGATHVIAGNVISGNIGDGVHFEIQAAQGTGTTVTKNFIGTDATGQAALGNVGDGVFGGNKVTVGGTAAGAGNVIAFNGKTGVEVPSSGIGSAFGLQILGNSIHDNDLLGIDLIGIFEPVGRPTITRVSRLPDGGFRVRGGYRGDPAVYRIEFFASADADPSGFGEGQFFLGARTATADTTGAFTFLENLPPAPAGLNVVTATVTSQATGQTSEFSNALPQRSVLAVGNEGGAVRVVDAETGATIIDEFRPLDDNGVPYTGLVTAAIGDVTGDGLAELIVAPVSPVTEKGLSANKAAQLFVYDGAKLAALPADGDPNSAFLYSRRPFGADYINGMNLSVGDVDGDGVGDIIAGSRGFSGTFGKPEQGRFVVFAGPDAQELIGTSTAAFGEGYQKGCVVTAADVDGDGKSEVVVTRGGPVVSGSDLKMKVFRLAPTGTFDLIPGTEIVPFAGIKRAGRLTAVDLEGDGTSEFAIAALDPDAHKVLVKVYDGTGRELASFTAPPGTDPGDVEDYALGDVDPDRDGKSDLALVLDNSNSADAVLYLAPLTGTRVGGIDPFDVNPRGVTLDGI